MADRNSSQDFGSNGKLLALTFSQYVTNSNMANQSGIKALGNTGATSFTQVYNNTNGPGWCDFLAVHTDSAKICTMEIIVDGTALTQTFATQAVANSICCALGTAQTSSIQPGYPLFFNDSLEIKAKIATSGGTATVYGRVGETG